MADNDGVEGEFVIYFFVCNSNLRLTFSKHSFDFVLCRWHERALGWFVLTFEVVAYSAHEYRSGDTE